MNTLTIEKLLNIIKKYKKIAIIIGFIVLLLMGILISKKKEESVENYITQNEVLNVNGNNSDVIQEQNNMQEANDTDSEIVKEDICVHVSGAVTNPGIVALDSGCRITDAIEAAGGITEFADISGVNLAYILEDGIRLHIPTYNEVAKQKTEYILNENGENIIDVGGSSNDTSGNSYDKNGGTVNKSGNSNTAKRKKVNINTASAVDLESLSGIGPSTASKIIEYRKSNGKFNAIDEIKNVSGIGNAKYEAIKDFITVK